MREIQRAIRIFHAVKAGELSNEQMVQDFVGMLGNFLVPLKKPLKVYRHETADNLIKIHFMLLPIFILNS